MFELDIQSINTYIQKNLRYSWQVLYDTRLELELELRDFDEVIALVNHIAKIANQMNHHPNLHICGNTLIIELYTHESDRISEKDLELATKIEHML